MHGSLYEYQKEVSLALHDRMAKTFFVVHSGVQLYLWDDIQDKCTLRLKILFMLLQDGGKLCMILP